MPVHGIPFLKSSRAVLFCLLIPFPLQAQTTDDEKIIFELEKQRNHAVAQHDEKTLSDLFDETYSGVTPSGKVLNKSEQLNIYKSTNPYVTFTAEDVSASVYETTAVVRGTSVGKAKSGSVIGQTRYLYVYLKRDGKWKIKVGQETVVIKE